MRLRTFFTRFLIFLFLAPIGIFIAFIAFVIESNPLVVSGEGLSIQDMERAKRLMQKNDPRKLKAGEIKDLQLTERDLNLLLLYALSYLPLAQDLKADVDLSSNFADVRLTLALPENPVGSYLNVSAVLSKSSESLAIEKLKIGAVTLPGWLMTPATRYAHRYLQHFDRYQGVAELVQAVKDFQLQENQLLLVYQWRPDVVKQLRAQGRDLLLSEADKERLLAYHEHLVKISRALEGPSVSLTRYLQPLFRLARERTPPDGDAEAENRAVILILTLYVNRRHVGELLGPGEGERYPRPRQLKVTLMDRQDLPKHFLISAALTATADSGLANVLGVFKEIDDSRGGTGFSFADLAADRAGVRFAELATGSPQQARVLQRQMSEVMKEEEFMPRVDRLPEGIMELEFKRRYQDLDSAAYRLVKEEVERRVAACRIYQ